MEFSSDGSAIRDNVFITNVYPDIHPFIDSVNANPSSHIDNLSPTEIFKQGDLENNIKSEIMLANPSDIFPELNSILDIPIYRSPPTAHLFGFEWKSWIRYIIFYHKILLFIRTIHLFGKFANIPNLSSTWLPIIRTYKKNNKGSTGLVPPSIQNEFFKSLIKYNINTFHSVQIYNSVITLSYGKSKLDLYEKYRDIIRKLLTTFKLYVGDTMRDLDELITLEFPFRSIRFVSPLRELVVLYLMTLGQSARTAVNQEIFEIVELHSGVGANTCSNAMVY